jgi:hypothetical protein
MKSLLKLFRYRKAHLLTLALVVFASLLFTSSARAQGYGAISGTIVDSSGAVVPVRSCTPATVS